MKAQVTVTVNGQSVEKFVSQEKSKEIQSFLFSEIRSMRFATRRHMTSNNNRNASKVEQLGNGSIRCA